MVRKIRLGILFGGQSPEHEVSISSASSLLEHIDLQKYEAVPIGINKKGSWRLLSLKQFELLFHQKKLSCFDDSKTKKETQDLLIKRAFFSPFPFKQKIDVIFPMLHGPYGEDGTIQGVLCLSKLPFIGSGVLASSICMDKSMMKSVLKSAGLPVAKFKALHFQSPLDLKSLLEDFEFPLFVKPANMGSSIGISKVFHEEELLKALDKAFKYDQVALVEEAIKGREIECGVLGNLNPKASLPGEIIPTHSFYSYEAKYLDDKGAIFKLPAPLNLKKQKEIQDLAISAFKILKCEGMARVDFFLQENGTLVINEVNTIPGFTKISLYPKLWEISGINYKNLIDELVALAFQRKQRERGRQHPH